MGLFGVNKKIIYLSYMYWIVIYTFLFFSFGLIVGKFLDNIFPKYIDANEDSSQLQNKYISKIKLIIEIYAQIALMVIFAYIFREYINEILKTNYDIFKKPDKFAVLIISSTMFSQQPNLRQKIMNIFN